MASERKAADRREYVILCEHSLGEGQSPGWEELGRGVGATDKQAIAAYLDQAQGVEDEGTFVAVPTRSFKPVTRVVQTVTKATWS